MSLNVAGAQDLQVGRRCTVQPSSKSGSELLVFESFLKFARCCKRIGTIRFVGKVSALPAGYWVGVELDEGACGRSLFLLFLLLPCMKRQDGIMAQSRA